MEKNDKPQTPVAADTESSPEPPTDFETRPEFLPIIDRLRAEQTVAPPTDFTPRVMAGIYEVQTEMTAAASSAWQMKKRAASAMRYLTETPTGADIALCFLLAGFFYFLLGVIFFFGLQTMQPVPVTAGWLRLQPQVAMITAGVLGTLGLLLLLDGGTAMRLAQIGTLVFIAFSIFNGMWISLENGGPFISFGFLCFTAAPALLGLFLTASLQRYRRRVFAG